MFWLRGNDTKVLCDKLASSEGNGWGKMQCCLMMALLIVDTIDLCDSCGKEFECVKELRKSSEQKELTARNGAPREVVIFIKTLDCKRVGIAPSHHSMAMICLPEKHDRFMDALEKVDIPFKNFGTWKA